MITDFSFISSAKFLLVLESVADLTIKVLVTYLGDKNYMKRILEGRALLKVFNVIIFLI